MSDDATLNPLPYGWSTAVLGDHIHTAQYGLSLRGSQDGAYPILRMNNLQDGRLTTAKLQYVDLTENELSKFQLRNNDLLFNRTNSLDLVGKTAVFDVPGTFVFASYLIRLTTDTETLDPSFADYYLNYPATQVRLKQLASRGVSQSNINATKLKSLAIALPPLPEQRAIAQVLRTAQQAKEATEKVLAATKLLKQSLIRQLFTSGSRPASMPERSNSNLRETLYGAVPQDWNIIPLGECAQVQTGTAKGRRIKGAECVDVPYLRVANVQDGYLDLAEMKTITIKQSEVKRFSLQVGDVVLTEGGDFDKLGRGFVWNGEVQGCVHQNHIFAVRTNRDLLGGEFLSYLSQSPYGKKYFLSVAHKTTNLACINSTKLKALPIPIPPLQEQARIVEQVQRVDRKAEAEARVKASQEQLFCSLLHHLMTGKVRVPDLLQSEPAGSY